MNRKVLFVYPEFEKTFWSWKYLLKFVNKFAAFVPLPLLTIAALFPDEWAKELVDLNVLCNRRISVIWSCILGVLGIKRSGADLISKKKLMSADIVAISGMIGQGKSIKEIIANCVQLGVKEIWLGGPILETEAMCNEYPGVTRFCIGKGERVIPRMLEHYQAGVACKIYSAKDFGFPSIKESPIPLFGLAGLNNYSALAFQDSWSCNFKCTFCLEKNIDGKKWQQKPIGMVLATLDEIYEAGFRGAVQIFSSNFAGNIGKSEILSKAIAEWQERHSYPFEFTIEVSPQIARHPDFMATMVKAGIKKVFLGLETDNEECLKECRKLQNLEKMLGMSRREAVGKIRQAGLVPLSGYIVGFDNDDPESFAEQQIDFIQDTCVIAMVDTLQAQPEAELWSNLSAAGRQPWRSRSNTAFLPNFPTLMDSKVLAKGFVKILETIWSPDRYYKRIRSFLEDYGVSARPPKNLSSADFVAFMRANLWIGVFGGFKVSYFYWRSLIEVFFSKKRRAFADVVAFWIYYTHFQKATWEEIKLARKWLAGAL